ncbi:hypothetical protein BRADI_5g03516v3 [Brachypodium distachyon]|uniref:Reverse transcriptase zinc-binding domain-containing protein n=1 Tax=Brachypodium distachyon TaxID=15368 RepID=A0A2K2CF95_BRADI|nr:hypothetical protein BRADI_5g03516v3 [Brachypodium distachyon]
MVRSEDLLLARICQLCKILPETVLHLCRDCSFTSDVRGFIQSWSNTSPNADASSQSINAHRDLQLGGLSKKAMHKASEDLIYTWWGVWKERNRRIFQGKALLALVVPFWFGRTFRVDYGRALLTQEIRPSG